MNELKKFLILFVKIAFISSAPKLGSTKGLKSRSTHTTLCDYNFVNQTVELSKLYSYEQLDEKLINLPCPCSNSSVQKNDWYIANNTKCEKLNAEMTSISDLLQEFNNFTNNVMYCGNNIESGSQPCRSVVIIPNEMNGGITDQSTQPANFGGFVIFMFIICTIAFSLFLVHKNKSKMKLYIRDAFAPDNQHDNDKVYDAYISIADGTTERKYVDRNFVNCLQDKHNYKFFIDDQNLLEQLQYSDTVNDNIEACKRLILVLTPAYMNCDWCMYCFTEGIRKLKALHIPMLIIVSDRVVQEEIKEANSIINQNETILVHFVQKDVEKQRNMLLIRQFLDAPLKRGSDNKCESKKPILNHAVDMDRVPSVKVSENYSKINNNEENIEDQYEDDELDQNLQFQESHLEFDDEIGQDPDSIKVNSYHTQKDFYSITSQAASNAFT